MATTLAPQCAGWTGYPDWDTGHRCERQLDDGLGPRNWLVLLGQYGQPAYFFCPACEQTMTDWIDRQLGEEGQTAGCTGMVRLETGTPGEVFGMIRDDEGRGDEKCDDPECGYCHDEECDDPECGYCHDEECDDPECGYCQEAGE